MENESMNQMAPQQPMQPTPPSPMPKKGHGGVVAVIVLLIVIAAAIYFWPQQAEMPVEQTPSAAQETESEDLSSLEAELEATQFEGISEGL